MTWGRVMMRCHSTRMDTPQLSSSVGAGYHGNWKPSTLNTCRHETDAYLSAEEQVCEEMFCPCAASHLNVGVLALQSAPTSCINGLSSCCQSHSTTRDLQSQRSGNAHPGAVVFRGRLVVRREDHDLVTGGAQPLDEALEAVLHAADVAEGAGFLHQCT